MLNKSVMALDSFCRDRTSGVIAVIDFDFELLCLLRLFAAISVLGPRELDPQLQDPGPMEKTPEDESAFASQGPLFATR